MDLTIGTADGYGRPLTNRPETSDAGHRDKGGFSGRSWEAASMPGIGWMVPEIRYRPAQRLLPQVMERRAR